MKTISLKEFTDNFMEISDNLTYAQTRMLYLLLTEPDLINISRQKLADKIGTHRRTIWLGIIKLQKLNYISGIKITENEIEEIDNSNDITIKSEESDMNITKNKIEQEDINFDRTKDLNKSSILRYDKLLYDFFLNQKHDMLIKLFEEFPDRYSETLLGIRTLLPSDINSLAKKYGFVDKLKIITISNKEIKQLKKDANHFEWDCVQYSHRYNKYKSKIKKMEIVRQVLIYHPFQIKKFLELINQIATENITDLIEVMVKDLYGIELSQLLQWSFK
jgi:hypothetical protein